LSIHFEIQSTFQGMKKKTISIAPAEGGEIKVKKMQPNLVPEEPNLEPISFLGKKSVRLNPISKR
jgi:hypothetical protein